MKTLITICLIAFTLNTFSQKSIKLEVNVTNVTSDEGTVQYGLYTQDNFMKAPPLKSASSTIKDGKASVVFENLEPGVYAIICFHDANANDKMDFEINGMPKESYGTSNNIISMGPPNWDDSKFEIGTESTSIEIRF